MILHLLSVLVCASAIGIASVSASRSIVQKNNDFMYYLHDSYSHDNRLIIDLTNDDSSSWNCDYFCYDYDSNNELVLQQVSSTDFEVGNNDTPFYHISTFCNGAPYNLTTESQYDYVLCVSHIWSDIGRIFVIPYFSDTYIDYRVSINLLTSQLVSQENFYFSSTDFTFVQYERCFPINYWDYIQNGSDDYRYNMISSYIYGTTTEDHVSFNFNIPILQYNNYSYLSRSYQDGFNDGYKVGYDASYSANYDEISHSAYATGYRDGQNSRPLEVSFLGVLGAIADTPVYMIRSLFSFEFFGISALSVFMTLLTATIAIYFIRKFWL